jgi:hypothetical protein
VALRWILDVEPFPRVAVDFSVDSEITVGVVEFEKQPRFGERGFRGTDNDEGDSGT